MEAENCVQNNNSETVANQWIMRVHFLPAEEIYLMDKTYTGGICLTNFRLILYCKQQCDIISIPNWIMRSCETSTSLFHMDIITKIGTTFTCQFTSTETCEAWVKHISGIMASQKDYKASFAVGYHEELKQRVSNHPMLLTPKQIIKLGDKDTSFEASMVSWEFERLEFDSNNDWKITDGNNAFRICKSYPRYHIMPRGVSDDDISNMASFRSHHRFPSVVWRSRKTGAVLLRCAQPCVGIMYSRNLLDERFVTAVLENCRKVSPPKKTDPDSHKLLIIDARDYTAAQFNRFRGGGFEFGEYYDQSQIRFMNLPNLHYVRKSFESLVAQYRNPDANWLQKVETTMWLNYISQLLKSAVDIAAALEVHNRPVMVHCTDGWDRTPQLTSLAKLLLDPYYRTIEGFRFLVEREWLQFGHKFADRCGHSFNRSSAEEQSPVFLQWLDCVHQIHRQFPGHFEFNELFLLKMAIHTYSGLFGTFLCNSEYERQLEFKNRPSCSLWAFLNPKYNWSIINYLYEPNDEVITPSYHVSDLGLWHNLFKRALLPSNSSGPQPILFTAPLRRSSSTLQISTAKLNAPTKSGPPTTFTITATSSRTPPTSPSVNVEEGDVPSSSKSTNLPGTEGRKRSQSLSEVNIQLPPSATGGATAPVKNVPKAASCAAPADSKRTSAGAPQETVVGLEDALNISLSDQNLTATKTTAKTSTPHKHVRTGSDPPVCTCGGMKYRGYRVSSLGDNDTLVVNETTLDDSHEVEDDAAFAHTPITGIAEEGGCCGAERGPIVPPHPSNTHSAVPSRSQSKASLSGTNFEGRMNWIKGYFSGPAYASSFRSLAKESTPVESAEAAPDTAAAQQEESAGVQGGQEKSAATSSSSQSAAVAMGSRTRSHTEGEIQPSLQQITKRRNLPSSTTQLTADFADQPSAQAHEQSSDLTDSGEAQLLPEHSLSVDWDGLPLQIDPITKKFHEDLRKHDMQVADLQAQVATLLEQNELLKIKLNEKNAVIASSAASFSAFSIASIPAPDAVPKAVVSRIHGLTLSNEGGDLPHQTSQNSLVVLGDSGHGNEPATPSSSIVEALTDAIDNQLESDCGLYLNGSGNEVGPLASHHPHLHHQRGTQAAAGAPMTTFVVNDVLPHSDDPTATAHHLMSQSVTDDMLLNWSDVVLASSSSPTPAAAPGGACISPPSPSPSIDALNSSSTSNVTSLPDFQTPISRKRCGLSTSSDYSTFDFVESSAGLPAGPVCSGCDRTLGCAGPVSSCSFCHRGYCGSCPDTPQFLNTCCKPICGVCHRRHFPEAKEMSASYECTFHSRTAASALICPQSCVGGAGCCGGGSVGNTANCATTTATPAAATTSRESCRNLERRFPSSGSSLTCSSAHSQNGTAKA